MRTNPYILPAIAILLCFCSCKNGNVSDGTDNAGQDTIQAFVLPSIPEIIVSPEQRTDFLVRHYWDNVNFADTNCIHHPDIMEQAWADYCNILNLVPLTTAQEAIKSTIIRSEANRKVFDYITALADKYLYDPNSPLRNEEYYIPVLEAAIASPLLDETRKIRPQARLELANKNRVGTQALDFIYTLASGKQGTLHQIKSDYTLLFINNPSCEACTQTIEKLQSIPMIHKLISEKRMVLLSFYPDEDINDWRTHINEFPKEWIVAYDKALALKEENSYDLKAIPTLYLLDADKKVLLKDAPAQAIEEWLDKNE